MAHVTSGQKQVTFTSPVVADIHPPTVATGNLSSRRDHHPCTVGHNNDISSDETRRNPRRVSSYTRQSSVSNPASIDVPSTYSRFLPPALQPKDHLDLLYQQNPWAPPLHLQPASEGQCTSSFRFRGASCSSCSSSSSSSRASISSCSSLCSTTATAAAAALAEHSPTRYSASAERASAVVAASGGREAFLKAISDLYSSNVDLRNAHNTTPQ